jgi:hypothetical protein
MRFIIFFGSTLISAFLLSGSPLVDSTTGEVIPNYQAHTDGTLSPLQQSGNAIIESWFGGSEDQYSVAEIKAQELAKRNTPSAP